jgi:hypothetical protein
VAVFLSRMNTLELPPPLASSIPADALFDLQLKVARRADELAGGGDSTPTRDVLLWFQAEREIIPGVAAH